MTNFQRSNYQDVLDELKQQERGEERQGQQRQEKQRQREHELREKVSGFGADAVLSTATGASQPDIITGTTGDIISRDGGEINAGFEGVTLLKSQAIFRGGGGGGGGCGAHHYYGQTVRGGRPIRVRENIARFAATTTVRGYAMLGEQSEMIGGGGMRVGGCGHGHAHVDASSFDTPPLEGAVLTTPGVPMPMPMPMPVPVPPMHQSPGMIRVRGGGGGGPGFARGATPRRVATAEAVSPLTPG